MLFSILAQLPDPLAAPEPVNQIALLRVLCFLALLIACMYTDLTSGKVYNVITLPAIPLALLLHWIQARGDLGPVGGALLSSFYCFLILFIVWAAGATIGKPFLGGGDVKLMAAIGALMPFKFAMLVLYYSLFVAGAMALWVLFRHGEVWAATVGTFRRLVWPTHPSEVSAAEKRATSRTISFCTAICVGGMIAFLSSMDLLLRVGG
jgi:prepilin peptidase CpaA